VTVPVPLRVAVIGAGSIAEAAHLPAVAAQAGGLLVVAIVDVDLTRARGVADRWGIPAAYSDVELLRRKDFADMTDEELAAANRILARLALRGPTRRSRRMKASRRRAHRPDLRRTLRSSLRHGGEPLERRWRGPTVKQRPVVLLLDVSGSMTPYARAMMQYLHASVAARRRVEAFAFGTRLTRITRELAGRDHDEALRRATAAVVDFSGGTRIGEAIGELNRTHGRRLGRGAVVIILSDGWDRGDPELLAAEMERLRRSAFRVVWLNPLAAHPEYAPLTRGMQAALPYTDHLLAGNSIASLEDLATILEDMPTASPSVASRSRGDRNAGGADA